jgi:hypothetical protein
MDSLRVEVSAPIRISIPLDRGTVCYPTPLNRFSAYPDKHSIGLFTSKVLDFKELTKAKFRTSPKFATFSSKSEEVLNDFLATVQNLIK